MLKRLVIGTRGSELALAQSRSVAAALESAWPGLSVELKIMVTQGDRQTDRPLPEIGGKGLFTRELEEALRAGAIDLAVHSLKDLPVEDTPGLRVGAVTAREAREDALYSLEGWDFAALPPRARVGTSSPRRAAQAARIRPDLEIAPLRGNVPTRMRRVEEGRFDATLLAEAGLRRLGHFDPQRCVRLPLEQMVPAPGQGALALQCRAGDRETLERIAPLHDPATALETHIERASLRALGGGCAVPVGAACVADGERLTLRVFRDPWTFSVRGDASCPDDLVSRAMAELRAREQGTLAGLRVLVTRTRDQSGTLSALLESRGAVTLELPLIEVAEQDDSIPDARGADLVVFTSANGVRTFASLLQRRGLPAEPWQNLPAAVIGPGTARTAEQHGFRVELTAEQSVAESFLESLRNWRGGPAGKRIVVVQGEQARDTLCRGLRETGAAVERITPYRTCCRAAISPTEAAALEAFRPDVVTFTSGTTARAYANAVPVPLRETLESAGTRYVAIGPQTARAAADAGLALSRTAERHDLEGLVQAVEHLAISIRGNPARGHH
ncbi:MAG TPA: hydroxymethylbilane synthase [Candidatus Hydrogenedentes bacterium]|nr:hydroxymethylbilane synthase [Candidatus Hydrogenedentota bacterium]